MSSAPVTGRCLIFLLAAVLEATAWQVRRAKPGAAPLFQRGQEALNRGRPKEAEPDSRAVLEADPRAGAAYLNLGVVHMRRTEWRLALADLETARELMPQAAGIRLNIGRTYHRQNEFLKAIPGFEAVVRDQPEALPPRYLPGLCYLFAERSADAAAAPEPLWPQESAKLPYLYAVSNAARRAGGTELDGRATEQLIRIGDQLAEYRLFVGKYHLNLDPYDLALADFRAAAKANPQLPFVRFNLGLAYNKEARLWSGEETVLAGCRGRAGAWAQLRRTRRCVLVDGR